ncbi:MAG TPA: efflux RND transporter periplasmic adaptor subunit [Gemmatimonadales bacterium]|nr:efflux RND transporter periplasmic adaptor subunit [Gemmatimonadales bacterium]
MSRRTKVGLFIGLVLAVVVAISALSAARRSGRATEVRIETVGKRDLVSVVTASGKIEAVTQVDISSDITGRIVKLTVREGDLVKKGQLLVQIDPSQYQSVVQRAEAFLQSSQASLQQVRANRDQAKRQLDRALEIRRANPNLIAAETVEQAQQAYDVAVANYNSTDSQVDQARAQLQEARDNLAKTRIYAPIDGRVTRLAVEEGEVAVPGTFSRETGLLMRVADLSGVLAKVDVDETDVVRLSLGDSVAISIDAFPDTAFFGRVTKIGNSAKVSASSGGGGAQTERAVDFEVEIELVNPPSDIRPDLSATARIVTDTRQQVLSIPIIALTVRQHEDVPNELKAADSATRKGKEREGVFVVRGGVAQFIPVKVGIAGEEHFEVLSGLGAGDSIVAGPYQSIRDMKDSTRVKQQQERPENAPGAGQ